MSNRIRNVVGRKGVRIFHVQRALGNDWSVTTNVSRSGNATVYIKHNLQMRKRNYDGWFTYARKSNLKKRYGLSVEQYKELLERQGGKCVFCDNGGILDVDHDHKTGKVRGLLCRHHNAVIGYIERDGLARLAEYLAR